MVGSKVTISFEYIMRNQYVLTICVQVLSSGSTLGDIWHSQIAPPLAQKIKATLSNMRIAVREDVGDFFSRSNHTRMQINGLGTHTILSSSCSLVFVPDDNVSYTPQVFDKSLREAVLRQLNGINPIVSISFYLI